MRKREDIEVIPIKIEKECKCCCPTCRHRFTMLSDSLYTDRLNWVYCTKHEENRNRNNEGFSSRDCANGNKPLKNK